MAPVHAQMILRILYARRAVNAHPSLASSLAHPELNGKKRMELDGTEQNGTAKKREEKRNGK